MIKEFILNKLKNQILGPLDGIVNENIADMSSIFGSFIVRKVRGKFQRSITFEVGNSYSDKWMEEALYFILSKYNKLDNSSMLTISDHAKNRETGSGVYYTLGNGTHNLKYREWNILLNIKTEAKQSKMGRLNQVKKYTIITYNLSPKFVESFEKDMLHHKDVILKNNPKARTIKIYKDDIFSSSNCFKIFSSSFMERFFSWVGRTVPLGAFFALRKCFT